MKIAVYDRYWATAGGGEKFAAGVASVLSEDHDVTLLAVDDVDTAWLGERLALDLSRVDVSTIGGAHLVEQASAPYDLLINLSYHSTDRCAARHGMYIAHFPHHPLGHLRPVQARLVGAAHRLPRLNEVIQYGRGFHESEIGRIWRVRWTAGEAEFQITPPRGITGPLTIWFGPLLPPGQTLDAQVEVNGREVGAVTVTSKRSRADLFVPHRLRVPLPSGNEGRPVEVRVLSDTWSPAEVLGNDDDRLLGVPLVGASIGRGPASWLRGRLSLLDTNVRPLDFLDSYELVLANSAFTQTWISAYWDRASQVLYPPVTLRPPTPGDDAKAPIVLSVGRFFAADRGHSKKQLELVEGWRRLLHHPDARRVIEREGWQLHLVGGCSKADRPYLDAVRAAARNLPVVINVNASGADLDALYRKASIYWHGAGFGEDQRKHPDRMEHFGITTVEAMSAGAVPVAFGAAGPLEVFRHGREGYHFQTLDELARATERLLVEPRERARLAAAAEHRARQFGMDAFAEQVRAYVDQATDV